MSERDEAIALADAAFTQRHLDAGATVRPLRPPHGTVLTRPTGNLARLWAAYAALLDRETQAKRQSSRKQRKKNAPPRANERD